jgi:hypothetical protein
VSSVSYAAVTPIEAARAALVGGLFDGPDGLLPALRALRAAGATNDVVGLAIPLSGDPTEPDAEIFALTLGTAPQRRRIDVLGALMTFIDPHRPRVELNGWTRDRTGVLAQSLLSDLNRWLVGVLTFRVPGPDGGPGVWVLGRPNHAAAVQGFREGAIEGPTGALASFGIPRARAWHYAERLIAGASILTTCETDAGRVRRDRSILEKHGARDVFTHQRSTEAIARAT